MRIPEASWAVKSIEQKRQRAMGWQEFAGTGYSMVELLVVMFIMAMIVAIAVPQILATMAGYRLHSDASSVAAQLNVARFRATSQFTPYRTTIFPGSTPQTFNMERLCGTDLDCQPPASPCVQSYMPYIQSDIESGSQYLSRGDTFTTTNPGGSVTPPFISGSGTGATVFYFNTRGLPVDCSGVPLSNGGAVIYIKNASNLTDAVTVTMGGQIGIFSWSAKSKSWVAR